MKANTSQILVGEMAIEKACLLQVCTHSLAAASHLGCLSLFSLSATGFGGFLPSFCCSLHVCIFVVLCLTTITGEVLRCVRELTGALP